jgi:predicted DCC family thiol-disulfide oxidoreductase YuxK
MRMESTTSTAEQQPNAGDALVLFDGVCNLCSASVQWIIARDRSKRFRFASLQSQAGRRALAQAGVDSSLADQLESLVVIADDAAFTHSRAILAIAGRLGLPWSLATVARVMPRGVCDALYSVVARRRYQWFGRRTECMVPTDDLRARFLDSDEQIDITPASPPADAAPRR